MCAQEQCVERDFDSETSLPSLLAMYKNTAPEKALNCIASSVPQKVHEVRVIALPPRECSVQIAIVFHVFLTG